MSSYFVVVGKAFREFVIGDQGDDSAGSFFGASVVGAALPEPADMALDISDLAIAENIRESVALSVLRAQLIRRGTVRV